MRRLKAWLRSLTDPGLSTLAPCRADWVDLNFLHRGPPVVWISLSFLRARDTRHNPSLRFLTGFRWGDFGYLPVYRDPSLAAWRAVWPLPLWLLHVVGHAVWLAIWLVTWRLVEWAYARRLVSFTENDLLRLRDLRLGRAAGVSRRSGGRNP